MTENGTVNMFGKTIDNARESFSVTLEPIVHNVLIALYAIGALLVLLIAVVYANGN